MRPPTVQVELERTRAALQHFLASRTALRQAQRDLLAELAAHPPVTFRLQEAYRNQDSTFSTPHWDTVGTYETQGLIDGEELDELILDEGNWTDVSCDVNDRALYRRVIEVVW
mgnify:CR=1 FL=1